MYHFVGSEVFVLSGYSLSSEAVSAASFSIFLFVFAMQLPFLFGEKVARRLRSASVTKRSARALGVMKIRNLYFFVFLPLSLIYISYFIYLKGFSLDILFAKGEFVEDGQFTTLYFIQKAGFFLKIPFYIVLVKMLTYGRIVNRTDALILLLSTLFSFVLFLVSGQRSGILLTMLELFTVLGAIGLLKFRTIAYVSAFFIVANVLVLAARFQDVRNADLTQMLLRRYFFDLEKIAAISEYFSDVRTYFGDSAYSIFNGADRVQIYDSVHYFIGQNLFYTNGGVPPSFLGEIIIYLGTAFILPVTFLTSFLCKQMELVVMKNYFPLISVALVIVLSHWTYFSLNSDTMSFFRRTSFDLLVLFVGYLLFAVNISMHKRRGRV